MISPFSLVSAEIIMTLPSGKAFVADVRDNILQMDFYENLYKPYIDCDILLNDDFGFRNNLRVQGTERFVITIGKGADNEVFIEKTFFVGKINDVQALNERSEVLSISLVEEHVFIDSIKQISRSYTANIETMLTNILRTDLGKKLVPNKFTETAQGVRKVIIPYMSPLESLYWLKDRATTRTGAPIFVHGDLYSPYILMDDLESLMQEEPINVDMPFRYSDAIAGKAEDGDLPRDYYEITSYSEKNMENSLEMYSEGAIGSYYETLDAGTGQKSGEHISVRTILEEMYTNGLISDRQNVFDPNLEIDGKLSDEYNSLHIHQVTSKGTYNQFSSYHDEATLLDENDNLFESKLKVKSKIIRQLLKRNTIDISMDGVSFIEAPITAGMKVRLLFLNSDIQDDTSDVRDLIDNKKSGDYLILAIKHSMTSNQGHDVSSRLTKLSDLPKDFKL